MAVCPKCNYEYTEGIKICPDCKVELVEKVSEQEEDYKETKWVKLHSQPGRIYSEMVIEALKEKGIPCVLDPGNVSALAAKGISIPGDESRIWVPEEHFKEANDLLIRMIDHI